MDRENVRSIKMYWIKEILQAKSRKDIPEELAVHWYKTNLHIVGLLCGKDETLWEYLKLVQAAEVK